MSVLSITAFQIDPDAKSLLELVTSESCGSWSELEDFKRDDVSLPGNYATCELNYWVLDGAFEVFPEDTACKTWGFWSEGLSGANGVFEDVPALEFEFASSRKSRGLTLYFYPRPYDYAAEVRATWFDGTGVVIHTGLYTLNSNVGVIEEAVRGFQRIRLEFLRTSLPYRYIKLYALDIGVHRTLGDDEIDTCNVLEEVDPTSESISINTLNVRVRTRKPFFSLLSDDAADDMMMRRQPMRVSCDDKPFGLFFLESWEDEFQSGIVFNFEAGDALSVLDLYRFPGGMYEDVLVSEILDAVFDTAFPTGLVTYRLDAAYSESRLSGYIPICGCGAAFQHVCFALNAVADSSRLGDVWIYPRDTEVTYTIPPERQYHGGTGRPTDYYSGVDVVSHEYRATDESVELYNGLLSAGRHRIEFSEPAHSLSVMGGVLVSFGVNFAVLELAVSGVVVLLGHRYADNRRVHSVRAEVLPGEVESVKRYEEYTLVSPAVGDLLAVRIFECLQSRVRLEGDVVSEGLEVGYVAELKTKSGSVTGTIVSLDSDLRAGRAEYVIVGDVTDLQETGI